MADYCRIYGIMAREAPVCVLLAFGFRRDGEHGVPSRRGVRSARCLFA